MYGALDLAADCEAGASSIIGFPPQDTHGGGVDAFAMLKDGLDFGAAAQTVSAREAPCQTVSRFRPFARRRLRTFRPPFVFIRSRNP